MPRQILFRLPEDEDGTMHRVNNAEAGGYFRSVPGPVSSSYEDRIGPVFYTLTMEHKIRSRGGFLTIYTLWELPMLVDDSPSLLAEQKPALKVCSFPCPWEHEADDVYLRVEPDDKKFLLTNDLEDRCPQVWHEYNFDGQLLHTMKTDPPPGPAGVPKWIRDYMTGARDAGSAEATALLTDLSCDYQGHHVTNELYIHVVNFLVQVPSEEGSGKANKHLSMVADYMENIQLLVLGNRELAYANDKILIFYCSESNSLMSYPRPENSSTVYQEDALWRVHNTDLYTSDLDEDLAINRQAGYSIEYNYDAGHIEVYDFTL